MTPPDENTRQDAQKKRDTLALHILDQNIPLPGDIQEMIRAEWPNMSMTPFQRVAYSIHMGWALDSKQLRLDVKELLRALTPSVSPAVNGDALAALEKSGKSTMTLNLSAKEMDVLTDMAKAKDMSKTAVLRQALRMYQLVDTKMMEGKRMVWIKPDGTREETIPMMAPDCTGGK